MKIFNEYQKELCQNGYSILKINFGNKACFEKGWPDIDYCEKPLTGYFKDIERNIGIKTKHTPAIDIDVTISKVSQEIEKAVSNVLKGSVLYRTGRSPKLLIPCQLSGEPFRKVTTGNWEGQCVEILSSGQQYVAFGEHPTTKKPYTWRNGKSLLDVPANKLPKLDMKRANKIIEICCDVFKEHGLKQATKSSTARKRSSYNLTKKLPSNDPVLKNLNQLGLIKQEREKGKFELTECPFSENHTVANGNWKAGAFYSQIGVNGFDSPFFHCCHAGCAGYRWPDLRKWLGITLAQVAAMRREVLK